MAFSDAKIRSFVAGATFSTSDMYKFVVVNANGDVVLPNTTGNVYPVGVLYGRTSTTSSTGSQAVPVAVAGAVKVQMAASTLSLGQFVASSTAGLGIAPSTDAYTIGPIIGGSSGAVGRINTVQWQGVGPLSAP